MSYGHGQNPASGGAGELSPVADVRAGRLADADYRQRFADATAPLTRSQALVEAERCLYCHDAPCIQACPTAIDVPAFIRRIGDGNLRGAAYAILDANPLGGICARVCPTEVLCEQACVRNTELGKPVEIGRLQRYAVDAELSRRGPPLFTRAQFTGRQVAIVGAGPAGLSCAHALARLGHDVLVHDAHPKGGGLNEYGLAAYKTTGDYAQRELRWLLEIGGIEIRTGRRVDLGGGLQALRAQFDAVFLALGLTQLPRLRIPGEPLAGVRDALEFIAELRQSADLAALPIGRRVVVIGGGMTAVDAAVQARLLGAESVQMVYRRDPASMSASGAEQARALEHGVLIHHHLAPHQILGKNGHVVGVSFARHRREGERGERWIATGEIETLAADMVLKAIGQQLDETLLAGTELARVGGRIEVDDVLRTSIPGVWAGGDCRSGSRGLTVDAVADGQRAAYSIHAHLGRTGNSGGAA